MFQVVGSSTVSLYNDTKMINNIKYQSDPEAALKMAAKQFEGMLYQQILKNMRAATDLINNEDSPLSSKSGSIMRDMHDGQLAMQMAQGGPGSISEMLVKQLSSAGTTAVNHFALNNEIAFNQLNNKD
ncbi:putative flagellar protein FlgJ [Psychromonas ingrahamii 37]|uniref:Putative flagellar protein FlgJ n=1 Tax=Psychromonas ingrahamii (strain DSM 17664 / CCUG 51855 / 37) TaxID=357804 RepID=A1T0I8_PSYIN|nr:rod-binding protein [Psychromonas ingrahamii]ABM05253.1 putative flagellar protein FlgJ [Psychromonas ingrahamii 37]